MSKDLTPEQVKKLLELGTYDSQDAISPNEMPELVRKCLEVSSPGRNWFKEGQGYTPDEIADLERKRLDDRDPDDEGIPKFAGFVVLGIALIVAVALWLAHFL